MGWRARGGAAGAVAVAVWLRSAPLRAHGPLTYDDGVFAAVTVAMRHGERPYRDFVGTQGPLYYALLRAGDVVSGHWVGSARLVSFVAGVALVVVAYALAGPAVRRVAPVTAAALVATSGALLRATAPAESDGVAAVFGAGAVLAAAHTRSWRGAVATGVLAGAALSTKNALAVPAALAAGWLLGRAVGVRPAAIAAITAAAVGVVVALPFGLGAVAKDSAFLHTEGAQPALWHNGRLVAQDGWYNDRLLVVVVGAALVLTAVGSARGRWPVRARPDRLLGEAIALWMAAGLAVLVVVPHLWAHELTAVVTPAAVLAARALPDRWLVVAGIAVLAPWHLGYLHDIRRPEAPTAAQAAVMADLRASQPAGATVVSDDPGVVTWAGMRAPGRLVDPSYVLFGAGRVTPALVTAAAERPGTCAMVFFSRRFDLSGVRPPPDYQEVAVYGRYQRLYLRRSCAPLRPARG